MGKALNPALADWTNRAAKRHADELAFRGIAPWVMSRDRTAHLHILSLPADLWLWEQSMSQIFPFQPMVFHGVERDSVKHGLMLERANALKGVLQTTASNDPETLSNWLRRNMVEGADNAFLDMVYFDWMGTWGVDKVEQIRLLLESKVLKSDSLFRFTIGLSRGKNSKWEHIMQDLDTSSFHITDLRAGRSNVPQWKIYGVPQLVINLAAEYGRKAKMIGAHVYTGYRDRLGQGVPEASFTLHFQ